MTIDHTTDPPPADPTLAAVQEHARLRIEATLARHWVLHFFEGVVLIAVGLAALVAPAAFSVALEQLLGWLLVAIGTVMGIRGITSHEGTAIAYSVICSVLGLIVGAALLVAPLEGVAALTMLVGAFCLIEGIYRSVVGFQMQGIPGAGWTLGSGIAGTVLGLLILFEWPSAAAWVLGTLFGINLLLWGWSLVMISWGVRQIRLGPGTLSSPNR
jgi:uncharacterized membrane protein HdeD (DUF308 family)